TYFDGRAVEMKRLCGWGDHGTVFIVYYTFSRRFARMNMKIKSFLARPFASYVYKAIQKGMTTAVADQEAILKGLLQVGSKTEFGNDHKLADVKQYTEFSQAVPVRDYEQFPPYINRIKEGRHNVL